MPICLKLARHWMRLALSLALDNAGNNRAARIAIIAMTTSNSINVKPPRPALLPRLETPPPVRLGSKSGVSSTALFANALIMVNENLGCFASIVNENCPLLLSRGLIY
jgi:hypothetical protein